MSPVPTIPVVPYFGKRGRGVTATPVVSAALGTSATGIGGVNNAAAAHSTITLTTTGAIPSGSTGVLAIQQALQTRALNSVADDSGNTWTIAVTKQNTSLTCAIHLAWFYFPAGLPSGAVITGTFASSQTVANGIAAAFFTGHAVTALTAVGESTTAVTAWTSAATTAVPKSGSASYGACVVTAATTLSNTTGSTPAHTTISTPAAAGSRTLTHQFAGSINLNDTPNSGGNWAASGGFCSAVLVLSP